MEGNVKVVHVSDKSGSALKDGDALTAGDTVVTPAGASVILVFSNGATVGLGGDSQLAISEFLQDPFEQPAGTGTSEQEPSVSRTKLNFTRGELISHVLHLRREEGSEVSVETPVGAAGIRGTTFEISFQPAETGETLFQLGTETGLVGFKTRDGRETSVPADQQMVVHARMDKNGLKVLKVETRKLPSEVREKIREQVKKAADAAHRTVFPKLKHAIPTSQRPRERSGSRRRRRR